MVFLVSSRSSKRRVLRGRNEGDARRLLDSPWTRLGKLLYNASARVVPSLSSSFHPMASVSFLQVPLSFRSLSLLEVPRALMLLLVFSLVQAALASPLALHPCARRRMLLEGIRRGAHGSSLVVALH